MASIIEMPELVLDQIIEFLDFKSVLTLRQVCRDFRNFIDDLKVSKLPDSRFTEIGMKVDKDICLRIEDQDRHQYKFIYSEIENSRSFNGKTTTLGNWNIVDVAVRDLELVLKFQKSTLSWSNFDLEDCPLSKESPFKKLNRTIKTKNLVIISDSQSGFMSILPFFDSKTLEDIYLNPTNEEMQIGIDEIVKTEQWRNAKKIHCNFHALNVKVEDICHLPRVIIFITSSKLKYCDLRMRNFEEKEELCNLWGPAFISGSSSYCLTLRQVCRDFRNFIDDLKDSKLPDAKFSKIEIELKEDGEKIIFEFVGPDDSLYRLKYAEAGNRRKFNGKGKMVMNADIIDVAIQDVELILRFQKSPLKRLYCDSNAYIHIDPSIHCLPIKLNDMFKMLNRKIKTRELSIVITNFQSEVTIILPIADLETLECIDVYSYYNDTGIEIDDIVKTEQWKKVKEMNFKVPALNLKVEDICHFSRFNIKVNTISAKDLDCLKKTITSGSSNVEFSCLKVINFDENEEILNLWGPAYLSESSSQWYFRSKDSGEDILVVNYQQDRDKIHFDVFELEDVPNGAIVQEYNEN
ncbi:hypothetical protein B9Z55_021288 [Caenorhabditis nigoni]|uniref:F-box domain-containing protein n=1 Tax=Caenorhabditis nigoni TaxID=1611254 RepID=A0A2G5TS78_9PELO|nr:hypothetical protein B9Z55_021288 [Caenorhabditis nigoni]